MGRTVSIAVIGDSAASQHVISHLSGLGFLVQRQAGDAPVEAYVTFGPEAGAPEDSLHLAIGHEDPTADASLPADAHPVQIAARLRALVRLRVLERTAQLRMGSAHDCGAPTPPVPVTRDPSSVLFVGAPGPAFMRLQFALARAQIETIAAFSTFNAFDYLHERAFDAVILNTRPDAGLAHTVCSAMRRNTRLYHTPAILLTPSEVYPEADEAFARGATDIISDQAGDAAISARVMALAGERRRRRLAKAQIEACRMPTLLDAASDLYSEAFGRTHLAALIQDGARTGQPVSVTSLSVTAPEDSAGPEAFTKALNQFAGMLRHCVRAEDFVVRLAADRFLIGMPGTRVAEAELVARRITAIAECTAYEGVDPLKPFRLTVTPNVTAADQDRTAEALIDQAKAGANVVRFTNARTG